MIPFWHPKQPLPHVHMSSWVYRIFLLARQEWLFERYPDMNAVISTRHLKDAERPEWQRHTRRCLASLTSLTVPPLPHTQSHGVHFQTRQGLMLRHSCQNGSRLAAPSSSSWTSILPTRLLKTEPPIDATRRLIILHPVATTTPHNVSGNAVCRRASFSFREGKILTFQSLSSFL